MLGMTYDEYWKGDAELPKYYRKADKLRKQRVNGEMWLQGMYIYDAFCLASPLFHDFVKGELRAKPYPSEPYPIDKESSERASKNKEEAQYNLNKARMEAMAIELNKRFKERK